MPIDFTLSPEVEDVRDARPQVHGRRGPARPKRSYARQRVDRNGYVGAIVQLRQRAQELGLWNPHLPDGVGRHGPRATSRWPSSRPRRGAPGIGPYILNAQAPDEGNMHTLLPLRRRRAEGEVPAPARRGPLALVLRDDRARGLRLRPDAASRRTP